jgi:N-acetylglucosaminyl-diphospho-decaprenol L-rhamnosyltransferase
MTTPLTVIIVTHDSARVLPACLDALDRQIRRPDMVVVVDSGSADRGYLAPLREKTGVTLLETGNIGFSRANNLGMTVVPPQPGTVVFMNPDTYPHPDAFARAVAVLDERTDIAVVGGKLLGYDPVSRQPTGRIDSTGIFRQWYGRWVDRGQGREDCGQYDSASFVPAVCGALLCCRLQTLRSLGDKVFDEDFFLYKEDIELSLRLRKHGWQLWYDPAITAYHCRGWQTERQQVPASLRRMAAANEVLLYRKHPSPYIFWAMLKYLLVRYLHI